MASPRLSVVWQPSVWSCERLRENTSTLASMSPAASSATRIWRGAGTLKSNQTLPRDGAHPGGSSSSRVASTVVPCTLAGTVRA